MNSMKMAGVWRAGAATGVLALVFGCSTGPATGTVNGEVTFAGQPIQEGRITFVPVDGQGPTAGAPIVDGKFSATGVPVTKMKVQINGNKKTGKKNRAFPNSPEIDEVVELLPSRFHAESDLVLDVKKGPQDVRYDLKSH
jgi:hypothetical protein